MHTINIQSAVAAVQAKSARKIVLLIGLFRSHFMVSTAGELPSVGDQPGNNARTSLATTCPGSGADPQRGGFDFVQT